MTAARSAHRVVQGLDGAVTRADAFEAALVRLARAAGLLATAVALVGFGAWLGPVEWRTFLSAGVNRAPISPNTALCEAIYGIAIVLLAGWPGSRRARAFATSCIVAACGVAALTLVDNVAGHALAIDHWLVAPAGLECPRGAGHMSPITAVTLLAQGVGLLLVVRKRLVLASLFGMAGLLLGWVIVTGYVADAPLFYGGPTIPVALLTGVGLAFNGLGLVALSGPPGWPLRLLAGDSARAVLLRAGVPWLTLVLVGFEVAVGLAFRFSGPARAYAFAGVLLCATVIDFALIVWVGGYIGATLDSLRDEQRRLAERLRHRKKLEAIGTFASGAAHEINNPLQQIMSSAELIVDASPDDPHIPIHARAILEASQRAATVTHRLLAHASVDSAPLTPARLVDLVSQTLSLAAKSFERAGVTVAVSVPADLPPIRCRRGQLSQALLGLLVNAREALDARFPGPDPDKRLDLSATPGCYDDVACIRLVVADQGCGMSAAIRERAVEPFFTTKSRDQGAGLGLWVAEAVVGELGGQVTIESTEGQGTRVILDLPIDPEARRSETMDHEEQEG